MKIDETQFQTDVITRVTGGVQKVQRVLGAGVMPGDTDALDSAFLDMLNAMDDETVAALKASPTQNTDTTQNTKDKKSTSQTQTSNTAKSTNTDASSSSPTVNGADVREMVRKELLLLNTDLSTQDVAYLKQALIPGLPIMIGSVPIEQLFPSNPNGDVSYRGFEVSQPLSDLINKGIKTGRPIRVELDRHSSIVLRFKDGRVSAEFLANEQAAALHIQQELYELRNRLLAKNLPVGKLEYRQQQKGENPSDDRNQNTQSD